jgi:heterodisulfide reductase subunit A
LNCYVKEVEGSIGQFQTALTTSNGEEQIRHGAAVIATGASEWKPEGFGYGENPHVLTGLELERALKIQDASLTQARSVAFLQCVGSRIPERPYCSKVCCTQSVKNALKLLEYNPDMRLYIIYRDLRTYGLRETIYREAREKGVHFIRYDFDKGLTVGAEDGKPVIRFTDAVLNRRIALSTDFLILASAIVPQEETDIARMFKVSLNQDGFYLEAHAKLRPVEFPTDGVFVCGLAHSPMPIEEAVAQGQAAAAKAATVLSSPKTKIGGMVAEINRAFCTGCRVCVEICPYKALDLDEQGKAVVNEALCKGCGLCAASCRSGAPSLKGFSNEAVLAQVAES